MRIAPYKKYNVGCSLKKNHAIKAENIGSDNSVTCTLAALKYESALVVLIKTKNCWQNS